MPPKPRHTRPGAEDASGPLRRRSPRAAGQGATTAVARYSVHTAGPVSTRRDGGQTVRSDEEWAPSEQLPGWVSRCQDRWDSRCQTARAHGIGVRTTSSAHVPETAENRRRLSRAEQSVRACSHEAQLLLEEDTLPSRWEEEYDEAAALDRAMRDHGLTDREREALWQDGVETVAWLQQLREEDFLESGIDVKMRRKQREAERRAQIAWEREVQAEECADPSALDSKETQYVDEEDFVWSPIDDAEHFARMGQTLDSQRREVRQREHEIQQMRLQADEAARAAIKRRKKRDDERAAVEGLLRRYRLQKWFERTYININMHVFDLKRPNRDTKQYPLRNRGAQQLESTRSLRFGKLTTVLFKQPCAIVLYLRELKTDRLL
jgi:hypothetical protein